jgi:hypothetical protein
VLDQHEADGVVTEYARLVEDPPLSLTLALSDVAHQLRATLDNLVGVIRTGGPTNRSAFVIARTREDFLERADGRGHLEGVSGPWRAWLERFQPYPENSMRWIGEVLEELHEAAIADRHRALTLQVGIVQPTMIEFALGETESSVIHEQEGPWLTKVTYPRDRVQQTHFSVDVRVVRPGRPYLVITELAHSWFDRVAWVVADAKAEAGRIAGT